MAKTAGIKIVTPVGVLSYPSLFEPRTSFPGQPPKYQASLVIPKARRAELKPLEDAIMQVATAHFGGPGKDVAAMFKSGKLTHPLKDGDEKRPDDPLYKGAVFFQASTDSKHAPVLVDASTQPIMDPGALYPGAICRLQVYVCPFDQTMKKGVTLLLNGVQKLRDGERIDGRTVDFTPVTDTEADPLS
jgi:hypothetical protein